MKAEKFIKLIIDYEHIDISENWVAFSISRTLEHTIKSEGIVSRNIWNEFLKDPFSIIAHNKIMKDNIVLLKQDELSSCAVFKHILSDYDSILDIDMERDFNYSSYKADPNLAVCHIEYVSYQTSKNNDNCRDFHYLTNLDKDVVYYDNYIDLPFIVEGKDTEGIFKTLSNMIKNYPQYFEIIPIKKSAHQTREDYIQAFDNVIDAINDSYIPLFDDFSAPTPEFMQALGTLKFYPPQFTDFNQFFVLTKKYVDLDNWGISDKKFSLILNLAILKSCFQDIVAEDLFKLFPLEEKIAQSIALDYHLKPKNTNNSIDIKKFKI